MAKKIEVLLVCVVTVIGVLLSVVGGILPSWFIIQEKNGLKRWHGIWFKTQCINTTCETTSHRDAVPFHEVQYAYQLQSQILTVLAYVAAIIGCVLIILGYACLRYSIICKAKSARCFLAVFVLMWRLIGMYASEMYSLRNVNPETIQGIPYGLIMSAVGSALLFFIGIFNFVTSQRTMMSQDYHPIHTETSKDVLKASYSTVLLVILFLMSAVGCLLQFAGFVSPGWDVRSHTYDGVTHTGLWYHVLCDKSDECKVESLYDYYREKMENYPFYEIDYGIIVGNEVCATLSLFATGVAALFGLVVLIKKEKSVLLLNITEICCLISVLLVWPVIGEFVGKTAAEKRQHGIDNRTSTTFIFPYSAFLSALGSTISVVVYVIHTLKYFLLLYKIQKGKKLSADNDALECSRL